MFTTNPFAELSGSIPAAVIRSYVVIMAVLVVAGTLFDVVHKGSARYFFDAWRSARDKGMRRVGAGEIVSIAVQTAVVDVLASGEFCNRRRRLAHLLTMYGFVLYLVTTVIMVFADPARAGATPAVLPALWYAGGLMVCAGGCWFWFFIRVDVFAEGHSPFRFVRADLFVVALVASVALGLVWGMLQTAQIASGAGVFLGLYLVATTVLFGSVPWSKFAHMFFKPAAALEKRMGEANGSRANLPPPADMPGRYGTVGEYARHY
jgi:hypothetical protein